MKQLPKPLLLAGPLDIGSEQLPLATRPPSAYIVKVVCPMDLLLLSSWSVAQPGSRHVRLARPRLIDLGWDQECQAQLHGYNQSQGPRGCLQRHRGPVGPLEEERMHQKGRGHLCLHAKMGKGRAGFSRNFREI